MLNFTDGSTETWKGWRKLETSPTGSLSAEKNAKFSLQGDCSIYNWCEEVRRVGNIRVVAAE